MTETSPVLTQAENNHSAPQAPQAPQQWSPRKKGTLGVLLWGSLIGIGILAILYSWHLPPFTFAKVSTDNAYIRGKTTIISSKVSGYVKEVLVQDFEQVKQGQPLVAIDNVAYLAKVEQTKAALVGQRAALDKIQQNRLSALASAKISQSAIENATAQLHRAQMEAKRVNALVKTGSASKREQDQVQANLKQAEAGLIQAKQQHKIAEQNELSVDSGEVSALASVDSAKATLDLAQQDLENTIIKAPVNGRLGEIGVKLGQFVTTGNQLMFLVPQARWVIANLKETDIQQVKVGQSVTIKVDALSGKTFSGKVSDIAPATASEFSVLKADSGVGNFVKIAQRVPVKIEFNPEQAEFEKLIPGMSVKVEIDTATD